MTAPRRFTAVLLACLGTASIGCDGGLGDVLPGGEGGGGGGGGSGGGNDGDGVSQEACRHLDIVISVDGSGSMSEEMEAMSDEVFGGPNGFANALLGISDGLDDYRVATFDACPDPANFHDRGASQSCSFSSGEAWIEATPDRSPDDVIAEFECVGDIDRTSNSCSGENDDERPFQTIITGLSNDYTSSGPNAGFLRDDAVLVVVGITDEDEQPIPNASAEELYQDLVAIKGSVNNIVFLGIAGGPGGCSSSQGAYGGADDADKVQALSQLFIEQDRGVFFDLCDGNLGDGLAQAVQVIETACDDFEEPPPDPNDPDDDEDCEIDVDTGECENDDGSGGGNGGVD